MTDDTEIKPNPLQVWFFVSVVVRKTRGEVDEQAAMSSRWPFSKLPSCRGAAPRGLMVNGVIGVVHANVGHNVTLLNKGQTAVSYHFSTYERCDNQPQH
jgi:hypothetical protein